MCFFKRIIGISGLIVLLFIEMFYLKGTDPHNVHGGDRRRVHLEAVARGVGDILAPHGAVAQDHRAPERKRRCGRTGRSRPSATARQITPGPSAPL